MALESKASCKSFLRANSKLPCVSARLRCVRSADYTRANVRFPRVLGSTHAVVDVLKASRVSCSNQDGITDRVGWNASKSILEPILQDQFNGRPKVGPALVNRTALTVGTRNFRTISNVPITVLLYNCSKFAIHRFFLAATIVFHHWQHPQLSRPPAA